MKILTEEEMSHLKIKGKGRATIFFTAIQNLEINQTLVIEKKEWNKKSTPYAIVRRIKKSAKRKFEVLTLADNAGWAVKRIS